MNEMMKKNNDTIPEYRSTPDILEEYITEGCNEHALEETLAELIGGIIFVSLVIALITVLAAPSPGIYISGLAVGTVIAVIMALYMKKSVADAVDFGEYEAEKTIKKGALIRYAVVVIVLGILMIWPAANPLMAFVGVMTLKVAAYIQPFTHKFLKILKIRR